MRVKAEVFEGENGQWYFRLKAPNGEIVAVSEGYVSKSNAKRAVKDLKQMMHDLGQGEQGGEAQRED